MSQYLGKIEFLKQFVCLFVCLFPLDFYSEEYWVSSRTMPYGSVGVFNGLLSLASVYYSVTVEKSMFILIFFFP